MLKNLILFILFSFSFAFATDFNKQASVVVEKQKKLYQERNIEKQQAQKAFTDFIKNKHFVEKWKNLIDYDPKTGKFIFKDDVDFQTKLYKEEEKQIQKKDNKNLSHTDRIYIFVSASIEKDVLIEYAKQIVELGLQNKAFMVIRGCIGGCKKIKPTLIWIRDILHEKGSNKEGLPVAFWIDPLLFRMYQIDKVPCVVLAENVEPLNPGLSEGLKYNLKNKPKAIVSCGDWPLAYHINYLYEKTKNEKLKTILKTLKKKGFYKER